MSDGKPVPTFPDIALLSRHSVRNQGRVCNGEIVAGSVGMAVGLAVRVDVTMGILGPGLAEDLDR